MLTFAALLVPGLRSGLIGNTVKLRNCPATVSTFNGFQLLSTMPLRYGKA